MADKDISKLRIEKPSKIEGYRARRRYAYWAAGGVVLLAILLFVFKDFFIAYSVKAGTVSMTYPSQELTLLNASGYVVAQRKSSVAPKITSSLVWIGVEEGSRVKGGQVIARLEDKDVVAARDVAKANLAVAHKNRDLATAELTDATLNYKRNKELIGSNLIARSDFDSAEARYKKAVASAQASDDAIKSSTAALRQAEAAIEYTLIRAPFDAVVLTKNADIGDIITPLGAAANAKASVVTIADMNSLQVEADVSESNIEKVKQGMPCEIQLDALPDKRFLGLVHMIVPTADRSKATVLVKVVFVEHDPGVLPDMSAKAAFLSRELKPDERSPRTTVDPSAIVEEGGKKHVFVIKEGRAARTEIVTGEKIGDVIEVKNGLKAGDRVVLSPPGRLKTGSRVKVMEG